MGRPSIIRVCAYSPNHGTHRAVSVIRLEMRLRMQQLLLPDLRVRTPEFTVDQLISLRFASDPELPALAQRVLDEKLTKRKTIKRMIRDWQADLLRA